MESQTLPKIEGLNVLVVDDEVVLCQSVEKILKRKGHGVEAVTTVADALRILDAGNKYDLIIADLMMPQAGGLELLSAVQGSWPELPVPDHYRFFFDHLCNRNHKTGRRRISA